MANNTKNAEAIHAELFEASKQLSFALKRLREARALMTYESEPQIHTPSIDNLVGAVTIARTAVFAEEGRWMGYAMARRHGTY